MVKRTGGQAQDERLGLRVGVLDATFKEERSRIRTDHAPQNMAVLRYITLNLLRQESSRGSLKSKRFRAALNEAYLATVLGL